MPFLIKIQETKLQVHQFGPLYNGHPGQNYFKNPILYKCLFRVKCRPLTSQAMEYIIFLFYRIQRGYSVESCLRRFLLDVRAKKLSYQKILIAR